MRLKGILNWLAYNFNRHRVAGLALTWWLLALTAAWIALLILDPARRTPVGIAAAVIGVGLLAAVAAGSRGSYISFQPAALDAPASGHALRPEERVAARGTGFFEVSGMRKYFVDVQAWFETVETREHIVIARNPVSRFLLIARTKAHEGGLWYSFFRPEHLRGVETGLVCSGWRIRPALRIVFQPSDKRVEETLYLAFETAEDLGRAMHDLRQDAAV